MARFRVALARRIIYSFIPLFILMAIAEVSIRLWLHGCGSHVLHPQYFPRLTNPAYLRHPWFSQEFLDASFRQPGGWFTPAGTTLVLPYDYQDKFFTIRGGYRETTGFPIDHHGAKQLILCFGGSTTYCSEVPDALTWPSQWQSLLQKNARTRAWQVINAGASSVNSKQEVERLRFELASGCRPYLCVFLNGTNDTVQGVFYNNPEGVIFESERRQSPGVLMRFAGHSALFNSLRRILKREAEPVHFQDKEYIRRLAERTAAIYESNMREAHRLCANAGCHFAVFLQPALFTIRSRALSDHEKAIADQWPMAIRLSYEAAYPLLQKCIHRLQKDGIEAHDLSDLFSQAAAPIFLDYCHVESDGNRLLAEAIDRHCQAFVEKKEATAKNHESLSCDYVICPK